MHPREGTVCPAATVHNNSMMHPNFMAYGFAFCTSFAIPLYRNSVAGVRPSV